MEWRVEPGLTGYLEAVAVMDERVAAIGAGAAEELIWLVEHPSLYTAGTSAAAVELIDAGGLPVFETGRGGRHTYHGPGQRVVYVMVDLDTRGRDLRVYVAALEAWVASALRPFGVEAFAVPGRVGVWVETPGGQAKIAAIGVRVRRWVTFHGFAINVAPDLAHFDGIVPCGIRDLAVTSLAALGVVADLATIDANLLATRPKLLS